MKQEYSLSMSSISYFYSLQTAKTGAARQSEFRLWRINKDQLQKQILDEMYHAVLNLRLRMAHEQDQAKEVTLDEPKFSIIKFS